MTPTESLAAAFEHGTEIAFAISMVVIATFVVVAMLVALVYFLPFGIGNVLWLLLLRDPVLNALVWFKDHDSRVLRLAVWVPGLVVLTSLVCTTVVVMSW